MSTIIGCNYAYLLSGVPELQISITEMYSGKRSPIRTIMDTYHVCTLEENEKMITDMYYPDHTPLIRHTYDTIKEHMDDIISCHMDIIAYNDIMINQECAENLTNAYNKYIDDAIAFLSEILLPSDSDTQLLINILNKSKADRITMERIWSIMDVIKKYWHHMRHISAVYALLISICDSTTITLSADDKGDIRIKVRQAIHKAQTHNVFYITHGKDVPIVVNLKNPAATTILREEMRERRIASIEECHKAIYDEIYNMNDSNWKHIQLLHKDFANRS